MNIRCFLNKTRLVPLILLLWAIIMELLCNVDSYLYAQTGQFDSAVFYMGGKALMNGMVPYVDFTDSKGVLLWFIYGIGYLIDNFSYIGVFWIACIFMWATLNTAYKIARLWTDEKTSLLSSMLMILPLLYWNFYFETKTEHFCWPFVMYGIYTLLLNMVKRIGRTKDYFYVALGAVFCLMIKWSIVLMMIPLILSIGWWSLKNRSLGKFAAGFGLGLILGLLPFVIYFSVMHNWKEMFNEYFMNTMSSVSVPMPELINVYANEWLHVFSSKAIIYALIVLSYLCLWRKEEWFSTSLPFLSALFFLAVSIRHDHSHYYIAIVGPFAIYTIISIILYLKRHHVKMLFLTLSTCALVCYVVVGAIIYRKNFLNRDNEMDNFAAISYAMSTIGNSTVIIIGEDRGHAMASTLPGTKYWMTQLGATKKMIEEQDIAIESGSADFVIYLWENTNKDYKSILYKAGYHQLSESKDGVVYTKHDIEMPKKIKHFTPIDVILKKNYLEMYQ